MASKIFNPLLFMLVSSSKSELARQVQYLKVENQILRQRLPTHIKTKPHERAQLLKYGLLLGDAIHELITIVQPATFFKWIHAKPVQPAKRGRKRTAVQIQNLILKIARSTGWGYTRIVGELRKLGIKSVGSTTVANILKNNGVHPAPDRHQGSWDQFIRRHADTLWACDFFTKKVWTIKGFREYYILFFIHVGTRRVHLAGCTDHPNRYWMAQQARNVSMFFDELAIRPTILHRDRDRKFTQQFDEILQAHGVDVAKLPPFSPNLNAHAERWVKSVKNECLDHFMVFGEKHLNYLLSEYVTYYNQWRPHQGIGNTPPLNDEPSLNATGSIQCCSKLGGIIKHFYRQAA